MNHHWRLGILVFILLIALGTETYGFQQSRSSPQSYYQPQQLRTLAELSPSARSYALKRHLSRVLSSAHLIQPNGDDVLLDNCDDRPATCFAHQYHDYKSTRQYLLGFLHLSRQANDYSIETVYCRFSLSSYNYPESIAPGLLPTHHLINTEHTWPQSQFSRSHPTNLQKSDLHHLFPALPKVNQSRGNLPFVDFQNAQAKPVCPPGSNGASFHQADGFSPDYAHRGNIARALFYFAVRYEMQLPDHYEGTLRRWHEQDPVDEFEVWRNERIFEFQKIRNPFIDEPSWVSAIDDF